MLKHLYGEECVRSKCLNWFTWVEIECVNNDHPWVCKLMSRGVGGIKNGVLTLLMNFFFISSQLSSIGSW